ncbi:hypothetical protein P154DRAFT_488388 [Amniculicola lignicola CBS 123094]|uniref:SET domain-containing protein n=1 Tax=Amniculicola lignicola CBS 123094 TaxID=1392246 RepID=A0A6A5WL52_9PLEO|nr:hypothetical protein P154DRAFT_488388 [Amniculicola lignicola CBS 123094]
MYTVIPSLGEGLGCFSTATIPAGTRILTETPLFMVREPRTNACVTTAFSHLTIAQQAQYLSLYAQSPESRGDALVIDIFNSNAWQTGSSTSILPRAARFNHSCVPNASFAWNSRLGCVTVHAIVNIPANTQIKLCYELPYQTSASRRKKLSAYGFLCTCPACVVDVVASDIRRARMMVLDIRIRAGRRQRWQSQFPKSALELARLLKEEGLVGEALGLAYHEVATAWKRHARLDMAVRYAVLELAVSAMCFGTDSPCVDSTRAFLKELRAELEEFDGRKLAET